VRGDVGGLETLDDELLRDIPAMAPTATPYPSRTGRRLSDLGLVATGKRRGRPGRGAGGNDIPIGELGRLGESMESADGGRRPSDEGAEDTGASEEKAGIGGRPEELEGRREDSPARELSLDIERMGEKRPFEAKVGSKEDRDTTVCDDLGEE